MSHCRHQYTTAGTDRTCPRPPIADHDRCVFHLTPAERDAAGVGAADLREAFLADVDSETSARRTYVDVHLAALDLSAVVADGDGVGRITFRDVTVDGTVDFSGTVIRHPVTIESCRIGSLDATGATFEMDVTVEDTRVGTPSASTCFVSRRGSFERNLQVSDTRFDGSVEFAACAVDGWLDFDDVTVAGRAHFSAVTLGNAQFITTTFEDGAGFRRATVEYATFEGVRVDDGSLDFSQATIDRLRTAPVDDVRCGFEDATVAAGHLEQPEDAVACYDFTDATVGNVDIDCTPDTFDRYRFYRTRFEGFSFASHREVLRESRWRIHEYVGDPIALADVAGLEQTYLKAKQGAAETGDSDTTSMFFVRELRYRRRRYATHATAADHSLAHRADAVLRWVTNGFLDVIAGYGERPQRTALLALVVIVGSALLYPATDGLVTGNEVVRYASHGPAAVLDGLYFSVVTFATLGLGDVHPVGDVGRFVAASEGLAGAFLTAVFVFSLGRRVAR